MAHNTKMLFVVFVTSYYYYVNFTKENMKPTQWFLSHMPRVYGLIRCS